MLRLVQINANLSTSSLEQCSFYEINRPCGPDGIYSSKTFFHSSNCRNVSFRFSDILPNQIRVNRLNNNVVMPNEVKINKFALFAIKQEFNYINPAHPGMLNPECTYICPCGKVFDLKPSEWDSDDSIETQGMWNGSLEHLREFHPTIYDKCFHGNKVVNNSLSPKDIHIPPIYK